MGITATGFRGGRDPPRLSITTLKKMACLHSSAFTQSRLVKTASVRFGSGSALTAPRAADWCVTAMAVSLVSLLPTVWPKAASSISSLIRRAGFGFRLHEAASVALTIPRQSVRLFLLTRLLMDYR